MRPAAGAGGPYGGGEALGAVLNGRVDSFVVEMDVQNPTDVNLLWDAMRVLTTPMSIRKIQRN